MLSLLYNIFFNPYLISFRIWTNIFKLFITLFQIQQNDQTRYAAVLPLIYSVVMSSFTPYSLFLLSHIDDKSEVITDIVYYGSIGFFTSNIIIGNAYYSNIINRNRYNYLFKFINFGMFVYYRQINKFNYIIIGLPFQIPMILKYYGILDIRYKNENIYNMLYFFYRLLYSIFLLINVIKYKMNDILLYLIGIFIYFLYNY